MSKVTILSAAIAAALSCSAYAQEEVKTNQEEVETIKVVGQRGMLMSALEQQREADTISSIVTNATIGLLPDQNVAEAVRRLAGVNVLDDQGEGRFISVRGLDPELNSANVNGVRLPAPEGDTRAVALDVIPSELVESIEVIKTLIPEMDADTIGATIRINTISANNREDFVKVQALASYNDLNGETSPEFGIDFSRKINDKLGVAGGFKHSSRKTSTDNLEMDGWSETDDGVVYAEAVEYRDYDVTRDRTGVSLTFDYAATDNTELYLRTLYSKFDDLESRRRLVFEMDEEPSTSSGDSVTFLSQDGEISVRRGAKDRYESQIIKTFEFGGETELKDDWEMDYAISYAEASEHEYRTQDPTRFRRDFDDTDELSVSFDYSNLEFTPFVANSPNVDFNDGSIYELDKLEIVNGLADKQETTLQFNAEKEFELAGDAEAEFQFGAKYRQNEIDTDVEIIEYSDFDAYTLNLVSEAASYDLFDIGPVPAIAATRSFNNQNLSSFGDVERLVVDSALDDFNIEENILALYVQGEYETDLLKVIGGFRYEQTDNKMTGNSVDGDAETVSTSSFENDYSNLLASVALTYHLQEDVLLRAGFYQSIVRPKLSNLAPRLETNEDFEVEAGNPELKPYEANNLDLSIEYYFSDTGVVQAGLFYKDIDNFIFEREFGPDDAPYNGVYNGFNFEEAVIPQNGESATVAGFEFAYNQIFDSGLIVGFNYTYTDTEGDIGERTIVLPSTSESTYNATLGYEVGDFSTRLTYSYRDDYLDELGGSADEDRWVQDQVKIDLSANYNVSEDIQVFAKIANLNDTDYVAYQRGPDRNRLLQYETYSWTGRIGVSVNF
ncbi:TonB-dependent receptor [Glaciecola petra]|uniref:TonB-dependent receptor n=1 Tax=Glaciecola petra TaxID=3075602 RepID=A0ABU2ZRX8_9ALTE|nr:TonB-dependent receptor [Aestuariibacter sp. P117]MDT0595175.1 TonB-dependent receptor [Aestuariibacter sp. P117]